MCLYGTKFLRLQREGRNYGFERKYQITGSFCVKYFEYILLFVHRLRFVFFLVFGILLCSFSILLINAYRASLAYVPSYELIVEAKISKLFGNGALYVNRNWGSPRRNRNALLEGPYIFEYIPGNISHLRLDLPTEAGARVEFGNIYIRTSDSYRPFAGRKLLSLGTSEIANWQIHTGSWLDKGRVLLTDRRMVEIHIPNAIDLDALLPSPA